MNPSTYGGPAPVGVALAPAPTAPAPTAPAATPPSPATPAPAATPTTDPSGVVTMSEATLQWVLKVFSATVGVATLLSVATLCVVVLRDGNSAEVSQAMQTLLYIGGGGVGGLAVMVGIKPIALSILQNAVKP